MKIVHLSTVHRWDDIRIFQKMCRSLVEAGHEVHLIIPVPHRSEIYQASGVFVHPLPTVSGRLNRMSSLVWQAMQIVGGLDADIIHCHDPELLPLAGLMQLQGGQAVFDMHENVPLDILDKDWIPWRMRKLVSKLYRIIERILLRNLNVVFAEASYQKDYGWVRKSVVVQNFPDHKMFEKLVREPVSDVFTLGYVGGVSRARGVFVTLDAIVSLKLQGVEVGFECVGGMDAECRKECDVFVAEHGLSNVTFHGRLSPHEALPIIATCQVGLAVLAPLDNFKESFPTKMFEYMLMGLPVVVSDFPIYREVVDLYQCGILVDSLDSEGLALAIKHLVDNPKLMREQGANGKTAMVEGFNWSSEFTNLLEFYDDIT